MYEQPLLPAGRAVRPTAAVLSEGHGKPKPDRRRVPSGIIFINRNKLQRGEASRKDGSPAGHHVQPIMSILPLSVVTLARSTVEIRRLKALWASEVPQVSGSVSRVDLPSRSCAKFLSCPSPQRSCACGSARQTRSPRKNWHACPRRHVASGKPCPTHCNRSGQHCLWRCRRDQVSQSAKCEGPMAFAGGFLLRQSTTADRSLHSR